MKIDFVNDPFGPTPEEKKVRDAWLDHVHDTEAMMRVVRYPPMFPFPDLESSPGDYGEELERFDAFLATLKRSSAADLDVEMDG